MSRLALSACVACAGGLRHTFCKVGKDRTEGTRIRAHAQERLYNYRRINNMTSEKHEPEPLPMAIAKRVGAWLKAARLRAGLTQIQAAQLSGVHFGVVRSCESGRDLMASSFLRLVWLYGGDVGFGALIDTISKEQHRLHAVAEPTVAYEIRERVLKGTDPVPAARGASNAGADGGGVPRRRRQKLA